MAAFLKPGGIFYIHEGHPVMWAVDDDQTEPNGLQLGYDYWGGETLCCSPSKVPMRTPKPTSTPISSTAGITRPGEIVTALASNGLRIELLDEKRVLDWPANFLIKLDDEHYGFPPAQEGLDPADVLVASPQGRMNTLSVWIADWQLGCCGDEHVATIGEPWSEVMLLRPSTLERSARAPGWVQDGQQIEFAGTIIAPAPVF